MEILATDLDKYYQYNLEVTNLKIPKLSQFHNEQQFEKKNFKLINADINKNNINSISVELKVFDGESLKHYTVPKDFKFKLLKKPESKKINESYKKYTKDHIFQLISGYKPVMGSDPEIFLENNKNQIIPAFEVLPDKKNGILTDRSSRFGTGSVFYDGYQAEFTTGCDRCLAYHVDSVQFGLEKMLKVVKSKNKNAKFSLKNVIEVDYESLQNADDNHVEFGCDPSLNAYGLRGINLNSRDTIHRTAGGHIHFGFDKISSYNEIYKPNDKEIIKIVKALDSILGVCCVSLFGKYDNPIRRTMYGLAGEYRKTDYGFEYRVLSNAWVIHPVIMYMVFYLARNVVTFALNDLMHLWSSSELNTVRIINNCNVAGARRTMTQNKEVLNQIFKGCSTTNTDLFFKLFYNGVDSFIKDPNDFEKNWLLYTKKLNENEEYPWKDHTNSAKKCWTSASHDLKNGKKL